MLPSRPACVPSTCTLPQFAAYLPSFLHVCARTHNTTTIQRPHPPPHPHPHPHLAALTCSQEKALLDEIKALSKKREELQIRLEQAQNRMDLAMVADIKYGEQRQGSGLPDGDLWKVWGISEGGEHPGPP